MKILALDLATLTGWAVFQDGKRLASGVLDLDAGVTAAEKRAESEQERHARRAGVLDRELRELVAGVDVLSWESVPSGVHRNAAAALQKGILLGVVYAIGMRRDCTLRPVPTSTARKVLLGRGAIARPTLDKSLVGPAREREILRRRKETKGAVLAEARRRFGPGIADDNEADALAVGLAVTGGTDG